MYRLRELLLKLSLDRRYSHMRQRRNVSARRPLQASNP